MKFSSESTGFLANRTLNLKGRLLDLTTPVVMGVLNVTPDSFYDGDRYMTESAILRKAGQMLSEGATILDIGGYSTRPGATDIPENEEIQRVISAVKAVKKEFPDATISLDTFRSSVVRAGAGEGVDIVNDVSGGNLDSAMFKVVSELKLPYILMHMRGTPATMQELSQYDHLVHEVISELQEKVRQLIEAGVYDIVIDPGFGFAKTVRQNFELMSNLDAFGLFDRPLLVGISRKSMIWKTLGTLPDNALNGSTVLHTIALMKGASILRVHDVREAVECIALIKQLKAADI